MYYIHYIQYIQSVDSDAVVLKHTPYVKGIAKRIELTTSYTTKPNYHFESEIKVIKVMIILVRKTRGTYVKIYIPVLKT